MVISILELEQQLLATITPVEMDLLRQITDTVSDLVWLTGSNYIAGSSPNLTLASGLSRALMLEIPALRFVVLDVGDAAKITEEHDCKRICSEVERSLIMNDDLDDKEFVSRNGILHVSRFVPDDGLNGRFSQRQNLEPSEMTLEDASPAKLAIKTLGNMDTIYFQQETESRAEIPSGDVDIDVKAVSLNAKVCPSAPQIQIQY